MKAKILGGIFVAGVVAPLVMSQQVTAWHPVGKIKKEVQNVTTNGTLQDAQTNATAVEVKTGDIIKYVITVSNDGDDDSNNYNDMVGTVLTDKLPEGVELVDKPTVREIVAELGTIKPGQKVVREFQLKVTSTENKKHILNNACFKGDSAVNDAPQEGCDCAVIKTNIPQTSSTTTPEKPKPVVKAAVTELPKTGVNSTVIGAGLVATVVGYVAAQRRQNKRSV